MYPSERSLVQRLTGKPFALVGVNSDPSLRNLKRVLEREHITWRSFWNGPEGGDGPIAAEWNVQTWPTLFLIDPKGVIRHKWRIPPEENELEKAIYKLLDEAGK
jgi:hypothetical protein